MRATDVPFLDLRPSHEGLKAELLAEIADLIDVGAFTNGPQVAAFEEAFAGYVGAEFCCGVASGLDALRFALLAAEIGPGDDVLVPAATFIATFEAVTQCGARPVPVDLSSSDWNIDPAALDDAFTPATRAVLPVHLYGQLADMGAIAAFAAARGVTVIEDACQAHGAVRDGHRAGVTGTASAFSFYPGKNLGAFGDAGALVTNDAEVARRVRSLREHGQRAKYDHEIAGYTSRLDTVQAIVLRRKLDLLDDWNDERRRIAACYFDGLSGIETVQLPPVPEGSDPVWHLFVVRTERRHALANHLADHGIRTGLHYPEPPHLSAAYARLGHTRGSFPLAEALSAECLSLPVFPGMTDDQIDAVVAGVRSFF